MNYLKKQEISDTMETDIATNGLNKQEKEAFTSMRSSQKTSKILNQQAKFSSIPVSPDKLKSKENMKT